MVYVEYAASIREFLGEKTSSLIFLENLVIDTMFHENRDVRVECMDEIAETRIAYNINLKDWEVLPQELTEGLTHTNVMRITGAFAEDYQIFIQLASGSGQYNGKWMPCYLCDVPKIVGDKEILDQREAGNFTIKK